MPKVSVVMASFNHASYVLDAIQSVINQSFVDWELVITDDGSRDETANLIRACSDARIAFNAFPENRGACAAMNDAIGRARGKYVAVLNSDDMFLPHKLALQVEFMEANPEIGAVFAMPQFVDESGREIIGKNHSMSELFSTVNRGRNEWLRHFFFEGNALCHPTAMVRRACYDEIGFFDLSLRQLPDLDFWIRLCMKYDIHVLAEGLTYFRILERAGNTSAPSPEVLAREEWERSWILENYLGMDYARAVDMFGADISSVRADDGDLGSLLASLALRVGKPGHNVFALKAFRQSLVEGRSTLSAGEYFSLVGSADPLGVTSRRTVHLLKKAKAHRLILAALNFGLHAKTKVNALCRRSECG